jgi:hypothetical protein
MPDKDLIEDWIRHAKSDLITARHMFEDVYPWKRKFPRIIASSAPKKR